MEKKKVKKNNNNDDLKFTPLDINPPFNMSNYKLNSITPHNALDGISINSDCNNIYIGFPPLALNSSTNMTSPYMGTENIGNNNIDNPYRLSKSIDQDFYSYNSVPITQIPKLISPFTAITSQNWDESIIYACNMDAENIKNTPLERVMTKG